MQTSKRKFWPTAGLISAEIIANLAIFSGAFMGLIFLIRPAMRKYKRIDLELMKRIDPLVNERNTRLMKGITYFGTHRFFIPANLLLIFYFLFIRHRSWFSIRVASVALSSLAMMLLLKNIFKRNRPADPLQKALGKSFPSGHAMMSVTFYGLLVYIINKTVENDSLKWSLIISLVAFIQLIGFSRVYLRNHYPSDILAGNFTGVLWLIISLRVLEQVEINMPQNQLLITAP